MLLKRVCLLDISFEFEFQFLFYWMQRFKWYRYYRYPFEDGESVKITLDADNKRLIIGKIE